MLKSYQWFRSNIALFMQHPMPHSELTSPSSVHPSPRVPLCGYLCTHCLPHETLSP